MVKEQDTGLFFVEVKEPSEVRRNILEFLKEIVETLQRFEKFKHIRHEKIENMHKLGRLLKDANKMLGDLKSKLPQTNLRAIVNETPKQSKAHHKKKKKGKVVEEKPQKKDMSELEKLESQLSAIESKLKGLA